MCRATKSATWIGGRMPASDRYYIKLYEQETNLRATLVLDTSGSMRFGDKFDYARRLAACLAYLLSTQQDLAGMAAIDESVRWELPPGSSPAHLDRMFRAMETLEAGNMTDLANQLHGLAERLPRRSMVILLTDLWVEPPALVKALQPSAISQAPGHGAAYLGSQGD